MKPTGLSYQVTEKFKKIKYVLFKGETFPFHNIKLKFKSYYLKKLLFTIKKNNFLLDYCVKNFFIVFLNTYSTPLYFFSPHPSVLFFAPPDDQKQNFSLNSEIASARLKYVRA